MTFRRIRGPAEAGQVTVFTAVIVTALLGMAGLVIDGGYALAARQQAAGLAEQAARIGADQIQEDSLRAGTARLDPAAARAAARGYLARAGHTGVISLDPTTVTVTVAISRPTTVLRVVGVDSLTVTGTASARSITGVAHEEPGA